MAGIIWSKTKTLDVGDGDAITFRLQYTAGDREYIFKRSSSVKRPLGDNQSTDLELSLNPVTIGIAVAERMVTAWTYKFPDGHAQAGSAVPITPEYIGMLDENVLQQVVQEIDANNKVRTDEEVKA